MSLCPRSSAIVVCVLALARSVMDCWCDNEQEELSEGQRAVCEPEMSDQIQGTAIGTIKYQVTGHRIKTDGRKSGRESGT